MTLDIFRDALTIDPLDCFPNASYPPMWDNLELTLRKSTTRNTKVLPRTVRALAFIRCLVKGLPAACVATHATTEAQQHYFFGLTHNQRTSLTPVVDQLNRSETESAKLFSSADIQTLVNRSNFWATPYIVCLVARMLRETGYRGKSFRWAFDDYWRAYGLYIQFRRWFRHNRPATVTVSNDHSLVPCVINKAAQDEGIPTFYIQHACVTEKFPPLRMDFALLEGADAMQKYSAVSDGKTDIRLIGIPKFDAFSQQVNRSTKCSSVGVCFSLADDLNRSLELLTGLAEVEGIQIVVRPHMGMTPEAKKAFRDTCETHHFDYSEHENEHSFDFLRRLDVLVSGTSSIALEAVLLNVTSLNFVLNSGVPDWYGFINSGLTRSTDNVTQLKSWITELKSDRPNVLALGKHYCASIGTEYAGRSAELAAEIVLSSGANPTSLTEDGKVPSQRLKASCPQE